MENQTEYPALSFPDPAAFFPEPFARIFMHEKVKGKVEGYRRVETAHFRQLSYFKIRIFPETVNRIHYTIIVDELAEIPSCVLAYSSGYV